jgi:protein translocase SecG subunit
VQFLQSFLFAIAVIVAILFTLLVFVTGKGDAMSGGSGVRTTFKGKASFEDTISRITFILGIAFMALMLGLDILGHRTGSRSKVSLPPPAPGETRQEQRPDAGTKPAPANSETEEKS